ncbi:MAG: conjugative transposon protein TraJ [Cyclobacteriaceae bacterium]|nr:conjugative transposon protein TraJ [Cyclobacteriaceae bacterium]
MKSIRIILSLALLFCVWPPHSASAQGVAEEIHSLQSVLDTLYNEMMPLCNQLIGVGRGIAAFAALWYIASRVWRHIANAEPIDFYPLLRPFAIGMAILLFPYVIAVMNGVLKPTVSGTAAMMTNSNRAIEFLLDQKEKAIKQTTTYQLYGDESTHGKWYKYMYPDGEEETGIELISNGMKFLMAKTMYGIRNQIKQWLSEILQVLYEAAALCINTIRTFYLIVLAILGPLVFGLSVFDGFQNTLTVWLARYVNVFLWLPVANIFGAIISKIQENMLRHDIDQIYQYGDTSFSATDSGYIIFLVIGIIGYFTVPSVANYIVHAGGDNRLLSKASNFFVGGTVAAASMSAAGARTVLQSYSGSSSAGSSQTSSKPEAKNNDFQRNKLSGNS